MGYTAGMALKKQTIKKDSPLNRILAQKSGDWLLAGVDDWLEESAEFRYDPGWFHPSSLAHPCDAFLAFAYMGTTAQGKPRARSQRILGNGTSRDEDWKYYLHASGISLLKHWGGSPEERKLAEAERSFEIPHLKIRGACDDIVQNAFTREKYIFEFKTMNTDEWDKLRAPLSAHVIQVQPYMFGHGILQTVFVYENKNTQATKQYTRRFDGGIWKSLESRVLNIVEMIENKKLPWRTPVPYDTSCQYYHTCSSFQFKEEE